MCVWNITHQNSPPAEISCFNHASPPWPSMTTARRTNNPQVLRLDRQGARHSGQGHRRQHRWITAHRHAILHLALRSAHDRHSASLQFRLCLASGPVRTRLGREQQLRAEKLRSARAASGSRWPPCDVFWKVQFALKFTSSCERTRPTSLERESVQA